MSGILYVVGTPIGNLSDFSPRAIDTLESVDFIAAEDTRVTLKLLNHFDIKKEMVSYFEHNKRQRGRLSAKEYLQVKAVQLLPMQVCRLFPTPVRTWWLFAMNLALWCSLFRDPLLLQQHWQYRVCLREGLLLKVSCRLIKNQDVNILKRLKTKNAL